jgi:hypothetical protein
MGESTQLSFASKISGEFLSIWAKIPQISNFFGLIMDKIRPKSEEIIKSEPQPRGFTRFAQKNMYSVRVIYINSQKW